MPSYFGFIIGYCIIAAMAFTAFAIRIRRGSNPVRAFMMLLLDFFLGIFVVGDLLYLYLSGRAERAQAEMRSQSAPTDQPVARVTGNVAIKQTPNGVVVVRRQGGSNYSETYPH